MGFVKKAEFAPYSVERGGYTTLKSLITAVVRDLVNYYEHPTAADEAQNAFELLYPADNPDLGDPESIDSDVFVVQATGFVDPLAGADPTFKAQGTEIIPQPWIIRFDTGVGKQCTPAHNNRREDRDNDAPEVGNLHINISTPLQLYKPASGDWQMYDYTPPNRGTGDEPIVVGTLGFLGERVPVVDKQVAWCDPNDKLRLEIEDKGFFCRRPLYNIKTEFETKYPDTAQVNIAGTPNIPMSYALSVSEHGIALAIWEEATDQYDAKGHRHSWFVCQRLVDKESGTPLVNQADSHCPLACLYGIQNQTQNIKRYFVVRESDVHRPSEDLDATKNTQDSVALINPNEQISVTENYEYVVSVPSGINTQRYLYLEEMDMISYCSADIISQDGIAELSMYDDGSKKRYKGLRSTGKYNTGVRILMRWYNKAITTQDNVGQTDVVPGSSAGTY
ncbi:hypothetical protein J8Z24_21515 (plasmid) [Pseudoalteromonas sp. SCSIO 43201]|uniref:hypothetical protein n=1 Tax=Pseudoalteromonas sp. SCSIO 43201 TaxID=2822842 RepID=UPI0020762153|nr:hypothetical protein [Pseudoalteromonas sp. SCSIO 43201]USD31196.1 hypothetical protein J8Z24_21515 [Pseudoalteromonas sp. SCSIO 43201]